MGVERVVIVGNGIFTLKCSRRNGGLDDEISVRWLCNNGDCVYCGSSVCVDD